MKDGRGGKWANAALQNGYSHHDDCMPHETYEVIYLIAKPEFKLTPKANAYGDVWEFTQEMKNDHPAAFPVKLIDRIISSTNAKIILDPFMGSGTTAISAINFSRNYIGIEISPLSGN